MMFTRKPIEILIAEDDEEDQMLIREAMEESRLANRLHFVSNGEQLLDYLYQRGAYAREKKYPSPGLILLDLNMPRKNGREALEEIRQDARLMHIPVIILTSSQAEEDVLRSYNLGVNVFLHKPVTFDSLISTVRNLEKYGVEIIE
jgi:CheY-like chemotaxis protein